MTTMTARRQENSTASRIGINPRKTCARARNDSFWSVFFFQAEDGIRDPLVTGVQTCALPISSISDVVIPASGVTNEPSVLPTNPAVFSLSIAGPRVLTLTGHTLTIGTLAGFPSGKIGRASCRGGGQDSAPAAWLQTRQSGWSA